MTRLLYLTIIASIIFSCKPEYKKCDFQTKNTYLKAYNDILNEIITKHSYNLYLGKDEENIFNRYVNNIADSNNIDLDVIKIHNKIFEDSSRHCTIYLDTLLRPTFNQWSHLKQDTNEFSRIVVNYIKSFPGDGQNIIDSLNSIQQMYSPNDFQVCIAKIESVREFNTDNTKCYIGKISFSKLILNQTQDKGLVYYEFVCGGLCGYGNLILIEKNINGWRVKESQTTWIS